MLYIHVQNCHSHLQGLHALNSAAPHHLQHPDLIGIEQIDDAGSKVFDGFYTPTNGDGIYLTCNL